MRSIFSILLALLVSPSPVYSGEIRGEISLEGRIFAKSPAYSGQTHNNGSLAVDIEAFQGTNGDISFAVEPFYRLDSSDSERSHGDLRTCNFLYAPGAWELTAGHDKVFWGVTEFVHLIDIINQTDILESLDGEEKLGQPMVRFRLERDWGMVDTFLLPYFRTRSFPGVKGRLRGPVVVDDSDSQFESGMDEYHPDVAMRLSNSVGGWDFGLYQFWGTSREPLFVLVPSLEGATLIPYYEQIAQTGLDVQLTSDGWLYKLEALSRLSSADDGLGAVAGFEYTFSNLAETGMDVGLIGEFIFDDRNIAEYSLYDNDLMAGVRVSLNDFRSTTLLAGLIQDVENPSTALSMELSSRLTDFLSLEISGVFLSEIDSDDPAAVYREDSFVRLFLTFYF